jgi:hypothetical protein
MHSRADASQASLRVGEEDELGTILDKRFGASASMLGASVRGVRRDRIWRQTTPEQQASEVQRHQQLD